MPKLLVFVVLFSVTIFSVSPVLANCPPDCTSVEKSNTQTSTNSTTSTQTLPNPLINKVITAALGVVGSLALVMFIYGGFTWMLSAGNDKSIEKGKTTLTWAALGLVIIFLSYVIIKFIFTTLGVN